MAPRNRANQTACLPLSFVEEHCLPVENRQALAPDTFKRLASNLWYKTYSLQPVHSKTGIHMVSHLKHAILIQGCFDGMQLTVQFSADGRMHCIIWPMFLNPGSLTSHCSSLSSAALSPYFCTFSFLWSTHAPTCCFTHNLAEETIALHPTAKDFTATDSLHINPGFFFLIIGCRGLNQA